MTDQLEDQTQGGSTVDRKACREGTTRPTSANGVRAAS